MKISRLVLLLLPVFATSAVRGATIHVNAGKVLHRVPDRSIGVNLEDLNYQTYGGLYSQVLYGETFQEHIDPAVLGLAGKDRLQVFVEENAKGEIELWGWTGRGWAHDIARGLLHVPKKGNDIPVAAGELPSDRRKILLGDRQVSRHWRALERGSAKGAFQFERTIPFLGRRSQRVTFLSGNGEVGIDNAGLNGWGINLVAGKPYEGLLRIKAGRHSTVHVSLLTADGSRKLAEKAIELNPAGDYQRIEFKLTPGASDEHGRFSLSLKQPGSIVAGYAFLQPGAWGRFAGLPLRKNLVEALIAQGVKVVRYDGSMVNRCPDGQLYKWKEMIGPRDLRKPYQGKFNPYASHGFAIFDFLNMSEAAGFLAIPGVRTDETPEDMAGFVEYVNGAADSAWGRKRAADGHPKPYKLRHLEIGNEERMDAAYCERFETLAKAIWARDPGMTLVISVNLGPSGWAIGPGGKVSTQVENAARLVKFARDRGGKIWWDCHYVAHSIAESGDANGRFVSMRALKESMAKLVPDYDLKFAPLEENGDSYNMERALAHALNANALARTGGYLEAIGVANSFQADRQEIVWPQGKTFFTASKIWFQPPYYVDQMVSRNWASNVVATNVVSPRDALDVVAKLSDDRKTLVIYAVNATPTPIETSISVDGFKPTRTAVTGISADLTAENTLEQPSRIIPRQSIWRHGTPYTFSANSFTVIKLW